MNHTTSDLLRVVVCLCSVVCTSFVSAEEISQSFRNQRYDLKLFRPTGANTAKSIKSDGQGLRLTLPANRPNQLPVGLLPRSGIRGDFEITMSFEILKVDKPTTGQGAGLGIWLNTRTPTQESATIAWLYKPDGEKVLLANRASTPATGGREHHGASPRPTKALSGKLRLSRKEATLSYLVAEGSSKDFQELYQTEWTTADLETVRLAADSGSSPTAVDVRINDVTIRSDALGSARLVEVPKSRWPFWLAVSVTVVALSGGGYWFWSRR